MTEGLYSSFLSHLVIEAEKLFLAVSVDTAVKLKLSKLFTKV